jgi:ubiquinone/menaquinone biosynthesis C-methylase UbiE
LEEDIAMPENSAPSQPRAVGDDATRFAGNSIPEHYDRGLGPVLFAGYGERIARQAASHGPRRALELAAGTGIVTRYLRDFLPPGANLTASDLNPPMLEVARAKFGPEEPVEFRTADATNLPFADASYDVLVCQFGVMFFPDKDKSYREARRVLAAGGRYLFSVFDSLDFNPCQRVVSEVLAETFNVDPPPFLNVPFGYGAVDPILASLRAAGFGDVRVDVVNLRQLVVDLAAFAAAFVLGSPLADQIRARGIDPQAMIASVEAALRDRALADGFAPLRAIIFDAAAGQA